MFKKKFMCVILIITMLATFFMMSGTISADTVTIINEDFSSSAGNFTVVSGGTWSVSGGRYVLSSPADAAPLGNISVHNTVVNGDFTLNTLARTVSGTAWDDFAVVFNYQNSTNYYFAAFNEQNDANGSGIFKVQNGTATQIADFTNLIAADTDYTIRIAKTFSTFTVYVTGGPYNNTQFATVTDTAFTGGKVGYASRNNPCQFDNLSVTTPGYVISEDFSSSAGNFTVVSGGTWSVSGGRYVLSSPADAAPLGNITIHNTAVNGDFTLNTLARTVSGTAWDDFAVVFNYQNSTNYYFAAFNEQNDANGSGIFKVQNGTTTQIADFTNLIAADTDYTIRITKTNSTFTVYVTGGAYNNTQFATVTDTTFTGGKVGYASRNNSCQFDNLTVEGTTGSSGTTFYVSTTGNNNNPGTQALPWRTIGYAATNASSGSTVIIFGGTYNEDVSFGNGGTAGTPTMFESNGTDTVTVRSLVFNASHLAVDGLTITGASGNAVTISTSLTDITIQYCIIGNCGSHGISFTRPTTQAYTSYVNIIGNTISGVGTSNTAANLLNIYGNHITVQDNEMTSTPNDAVNMWGDSHVYRHNHIYNIYNSFGHHNDAFQVWTGYGDGVEGNALTNLTIDRNTIYSVTGPDAHFVMAEGPGHQNWTITNNVINQIGNQGMILGKTGNGTQGIQNVTINNNTWVSAGSSNTIECNLSTTATIKNNIFYNSPGWGGHPPYYAGPNAVVTADYNLSGGTSPTLSEAHGINANPSFVNAGASNFHLASNSPAINTGCNTGLAEDLDGNTRPSGSGYDRGAYEY